MKKSLFLFDLLLLVLFVIFIFWVMRHFNQADVVKSLNPHLQLRL